MNDTDYALTFLNAHMDSNDWPSMSEGFAILCRVKFCLEYTNKTTPEQRRQVTYTVRKNEHGEYVVRFRKAGVRMPTWDYFASDIQDAHATARMTIIHSFYNQK